MIVVLKNNTTKADAEELSKILTQKYGVTVNAWYGELSTVLGLLGDTHKVDIDSISAFEAVESVKRVQEPYKKVNRAFHTENTVITLENGLKIGDGSLNIIAGPCSVESEEQIVGIAKRVKESGATMLRGGAFKPRTSPYAFQGLRAIGIELLLEAKKETGLPSAGFAIDIIAFWGI